MTISVQIPFDMMSGPSKPRIRAYEKNPHKAARYFVVELYADDRKVLFRQEVIITPESRTGGLG